MSQELTEKPMNIWWCNQFNDWQFERPAECVCASAETSSHTYRKTVGEVHAGDIVIHYRKPRVVAISQAQEDGSFFKKLPLVSGQSYGSGWRFKTAYHDLTTPVNKLDFASELADLSKRDYAINPNGSAKQGYFLQFDEAGLRVILKHLREPVPEWLLAALGESPVSEVDTVTLPTRKEVLLQQLQRDQRIVREIKDLYENVCMLCGRIIMLPDGNRYSEVHHIRPLGGLEQGTDTTNNLICVCPTCHVELDYGCREIDPMHFAVPLRHTLSQGNINYHNERIFQPPSPG